MPKNKRAVWWIKRDMRLSDNTALVQAIEECEQVLPVFVWEPSLIHAPDTSAFHTQAWGQALAELKQQLRAKGAELVHIQDEVIPAFERLRHVYAFTHLYSHEETGNNLTFTRDKSIQQWCTNHGVVWKEFPQSGVIRGLVSRDGRDAIWKQRIVDSQVCVTPARVPLNLHMQEIAAKMPAPPLPQVSSPHVLYPIQHVSEAHARQILHDFLYDRGVGYSGGISSPNKAFHRGSRFSVHLAWGTLSLRQAYQATLSRLRELKAQPEPGPWSKSLRAFLSRLHWRDHFIQRLESAPSMEFHALNEAYETLPYTNNPVYLQAWADGLTGYPLVDACMRCLAGCGFLNFRMRAMVVSFACFSLHLDWRYIHNHLARVFRDYEPGIHLSQLQMQAGVVGINTIRVYSPTKQMLDQDPDCAFVKAWIPELRDFTAAEIMSYQTYRLGDYPRPVVNHKEQSKRMKDAVFAIRKQKKTKSLSQKVYAAHGSRKRKGNRKKSVKENPSQPRLFVV